MSGLVKIFFLIILWGNVVGQSSPDSLIHIYHNSKNDSHRIDAAIRLYDLMVAKFPDSLYPIIDNAILLAKNEGLEEQALSLTILKGQVFDRLNDYVKAQQIFFRAERSLDSLQGLIPDSSYLKHRISIFNDIATIFFRTGKLDDARKYYEKIITLLESTPASGLPANLKQYYMIAYNNIGSVYLQDNKYDPAETYYLKAMSYLEENNKRGMSSILNNLGIIEKDRNSYDKSYDYLTRAIRIRRESGFLEGEVQSLNNMGDLLWKMGDSRKALDTLRKVSRLAKENQLLRSNNIALEKIARILYERGDYENAYLTHVEFKVHYDSLMDQENLNNITQLEMQHRFEQKLEEDNVFRQKEDLVRQRRETMYLFTIITASLIVIVLFMLYALQRGKLKRHHLMAEKERLMNKSLELENEKLSLNLEYKNKELTTNVIYLARTSEFIAEVAEKLIKRRIYFTLENQKLIDELIRDLQSYSDKNTWREFEIRFQEVHTNFYTKLLELHPDLSANEKKLSAFLRLNMTTKEIAAITYQSVNSITVARSRLRKKLGIDKEENLITYLEQL